MQNAIYMNNVDEYIVPTPYIFYNNKKKKEKKEEVNIHMNAYLFPSVFIYTYSQQELMSRSIQYAYNVQII